MFGPVRMDMADRTAVQRLGSVAGDAIDRAVDPGGVYSSAAMTTNDKMPLGNFSVSLTVKDLARSRSFYEKLGFVQCAGNGRSYVIMQSGAATIGLFQGMFERNILTFNPGWDSACNKLPEFLDVRELQRRLRASGVEPVTAVDEATSGPGSFVVVDPDGNPILFDQHV